MPAQWPDDLAHYDGPEFCKIGDDELIRAIDADRIDMESGDMLLLRTGFAKQPTGIGLTAP